MPTPLWEPKKAVYSVWLKTLTKEQYNLHLEERRQRKNTKKQFQKLAQFSQVQILTKMHNALMKSLETAEQTGDMTTIEKVAKLLEITTPDVISPDTDTEVNINITGITKE